MQKKYRKCVGMMILNTKNQVLVGKRLDNPSGYWQMPQGGIDENENPEEAVWREMMEEIGTNKASLIASSKEWISYDIPDINVETPNPEFSEWKWIEHSELIENAVPFKRKVYETVLNEFEDTFN